MSELRKIINSMLNDKISAENVRDALKELDGMKQEESDLKKRLEALKKERESLTKANDEMKLDSEKILAVAHAEREKARNDAEEAKKASEVQIKYFRDSRKKELAAINGEIELARANHQEIIDLVKAKNGELSVIEGKISALKMQISEMAALASGGAETKLKG